MIFGEDSFFAVQDSSISDIVGLSVCRSEPTNNQSLGRVIAYTTVTLQRHYSDTTVTL